MRTQTYITVNNGLRACPKNGSRRGNEADGCARNPPPYLGGYGAWQFFRHALKCMLGTALIVWAETSAHAQQAGPSLVDTNLAVRAVTTNLTQPTSMAFIGANDILVLEKASGKVQRVVDG